MPNLVIVAIPSEDDYVHKISSEKVAHMTLCFLGDVSQVSDISGIIEFTKHAADQSLMRFGMEVDHRGELGVDQADVLFFSKSKWGGYESVNQYRSYLLKNDAIRTAYDSADQHDEWNPHLTLGYPDTPANQDTRDYPGIQYVNFDRIAVWYNEFDGVEFMLNSYNWGEDMVMSNGANAVTDILSHHGIKGMHWGMRKEVDSAIADVPKKTRKLAASDAEEFTRAKLFYGKGAGTRRKLIKAHVAARKERDPLYAKAFDHFVSKTNLSKRADQARKQRKSTDRRASAKRNAKIISRIVGPAISTSLQSSHSQMLNDRGRVTPYARHSDILREGNNTVQNIIEHHGTKGMKWGVRNAPSQVSGHIQESRARARSSEVTVSDKRKKLKTTGGAGHVGHPDAVKARTSGQIAKKSGVKALSNADLRAFNERLNLEQNYHRLTFEEASPGKKFVTSLFKPTKKGGPPPAASGAWGLAKQTSTVRKKMQLGATAIALL